MKMLRLGALAALVMLSSCLFTPGKFEAAMDVRRDGSFTYRYAGEIVFATSNAMAGSAATTGAEPFDPEHHQCWEEPGPDDETLEARECTPEELEEARKEHVEESERRAAEQRKEQEAMAAMFGGMNPNDPATMDEFARRLQTYDGWKRVVHKGEGVFDVAFETSGRLDRAFVFPMFPEVDFIVPFIQAARRDGNKLRIVAPAFVQGADMMAGAGAMGGAMNPNASTDRLVQAEGRFTLTTDAAILTNNTREGPADGPGGTKVLTWTVGPLDKAKPEALLEM